MDIEAVIAEAQANQANANSESVAEETAGELEKPSQENKEDNDNRVKPDSELTPEQLAKREANRQSHRNSKEARLKRELRELRELVERSNLLQNKSQEKTSSNSDRPVRPLADNYNDWIEYERATDKYNEDLADWKVKQALSERDEGKRQESKLQAEQAKIVERGQKIAQQEKEFSDKVPEYKALYQEYSDYLSSMPYEVAIALSEAENTPLAVYALMKEGLLESLEDMSPVRMAMEIGKAELRGEKYINQRKVTNAPEPAKSVKGLSSPNKSLNEKSVEELLNYARSN